MELAAIFGNISVDRTNLSVLSGSDVPSYEPLISNSLAGPKDVEINPCLVLIL